MLEPIASTEAEFRDLVQQKDVVIKAKGEEIAEWKQKMDDMAHEFGIMLKVRATMSPPWTCNMCTYCSDTHQHAHTYSLTHKPRAYTHKHKHTQTRANTPTR